MSNTLNLSEKYFELYKEFYLSNNLVLSGSNVLNWTPGFTRSLDCCNILQKAANKCFCGIQETLEKKVVLDEVWFYSSLEKSFEKYKFDEIDSHRKELEEFISSFLERENYEYGLTLNFLSEKSKGNGFYCFSSFSVLISTALYIVTKQLDIRLLKDYNKFLSSPIFNDVFHTSMEISKIFYGKKTEGANYCILTKEKFPLVYLPHSRYQKSSYMKDLGDNIFKMLDIENIPESLPFDYGVMFFGRNHSLDELNSIYPNIKEEHSEIFNEFVPMHIGRLSEGLYEKDTNKYLLQNIDFHIFKVLKSFQKLLLHRYENENMKKFLNAINDQGILGISAEKDFKLYSKIHSLFDELKNISDEELGLFPFTMGRYGGAFFFVTKFNISRDTINKLIEKIKLHGYTNSYIDYASRREGYATDGIIVEQYLTRDIFSDYVSKNHLIYWDNSSNVSLATYQDITSNYKEGLLLDKIKKKIYVNGELVSSKYLHSQSATIDILEYLLKNKDSELLNILFPPSSYIKNRNEFLTKIVYPLQRVLEENFGSTLNIECYGGVKTFYIKFENNPKLKIALIDYVTKEI